MEEKPILITRWPLGHVVLARCTLSTSNDASDFQLSIFVDFEFRASVVSAAVCSERRRFEFQTAERIEATMYRSIPSHIITPMRNVGRLYSSWPCKSGNTIAAEGLRACPVTLLHRRWTANEPVAMTDDSLPPTAPLVPWGVCACRARETRRGGKPNSVENAKLRRTPTNAEGFPTIRNRGISALRWLISSRTSMQCMEVPSVISNLD